MIKFAAHELKLMGKLEKHSEQLRELLLQAETTADEGLEMLSFCNDDNKLAWVRLLTKM